MLSEAKDKGSGCAGVEAGGSIDDDWLDSVNIEIGSTMMRTYYHVH